MSEIIEIRNLKVYAGEKKILSGLNVDIHRNTVNTVLGPSGGGKSTLLRTLNRLTDIDPVYSVEGSIRFDGRDVREYDEIELRRRVGLIFQKPNPFPLSIYDNVAFGIRLHAKVAKAQLDEMVEESLRDSGLWDEVQDDLGRSALTLSGGQQQRLCIARSLILQPEVVMMDEPTSSLDPSAKARIEELILALKDKYTVILVTHDISQAKKVSDYTSLIYNGKIVATGEGGDFLESSTNSDMKSFLGEVSV